MASVMYLEEILIKSRRPAVAQSWQHLFRIATKECIRNRCFLTPLISFLGVEGQRKILRVRSMSHLCVVLWNDVACVLWNCDRTQYTFNCESLNGEHLKKKTVSYLKFDFKINVSVVSCEWLYIKNIYFFVRDNCTVKFLEPILYSL